MLEMTVVSSANFVNLASRELGSMIELGSISRDHGGVLGPEFPLQVQIRIIITKAFN